MSRALTGKQVVLGVTGCIGAYKAAELVRMLTRAGAAVHVVMTRSACEFITPLTLQTLTANPVATELFELYAEREIGHIALAQRADVLLIAPATANCIGKIASGIADDLLTSVVMATRSPVVIAPAMNDGMWCNPAVQENITRLRARGCHVVGPGTGELACGTSGPGRLADLEDIVDAVSARLCPDDFAGQRVLVSAGPTREAIDPIRYLTNASSGRTGYSMARAFQHRGARVTLVSGPVALAPPLGVACISVTTAAEMATEVCSRFDDQDIVVMTAAVADYRPAAPVSHKLKKQADGLALSLERTTDILAELGRRKQRQLLVGFAAETDDLLANARDKLVRKHLDLVVANDVSTPGLGFAADRNRVVCLTADGADERLPEMDKQELAHCLLDRIGRLRGAAS